MTTPISILIIDDSKDILLATSRLLRNAGYQVSEAEDGRSGLAALAEQRPDLVLLDVQLPDISGYEICRRIKADSTTKSSYVLMLSNQMNSSDHQAQGLEIGADGYVSRPIANRELLARVQAMARIIRAEQERDRLIDELQRALAMIKTLRGMLPICAACKKIRNDSGYWEEVELYVKKHSDAEFTHGICPDCEQRLYGDLGHD